MRNLLLALVLGLIPAPCLAHQPVVVPVTTTTREAPLEVKEPEVSKAYFGQLAGSPAWFRITSDRPFRFYAGITAPKVGDCPLERRFSVEVQSETGTTLAVADGDTFTWWPWYESFGKKWYWVGPEMGANFKSTQDFSAGTYYLRVYNSDNRGRYVLAVGDAESFPVDVIIKTMIILPGINRDFWDNVTCEGK